MTRIDRLTALIERDRRALELIGVRNAVRIGATARIHAIAALRTGHSPAQAIRDVLHGNARLGLTGIVPLIRDGMVAAHLTGRKRTELNAAPQVKQLSRKRFSGTAYDDALEFLAKRLQLTPQQLRALGATYESEALRVTTQMSASLESAAQKAVLETTREGGGVRDGIKALREAFESEGVAPQADYRLEAVFRTQTQISYSAGRYSAQQDPAIQDILWGFQYTAIGDDRTTEICAALDGMTRAKEDPVWARLTPPNHYSCRSTVLELFSPEPETDVPDVEAEPGFGINFGGVFRDSIRPLAA